jgi:hypothetical protein
VATARSVVRDLASVLGAGAVLAEPPAEYLADQTEGRGLTGRADAVALPGSTAEVAGCRRMVLRPRRPDCAARRRDGLRGRRRADRRRSRALSRAPYSGALVRAAPLAHRGRGRPAHGGAPANRARKRAPVPARSRCRRAVADRRQHRYERGWPPRLQVRRHRGLGDGPGSGHPARGRGRRRRSDPQGRRRLRPQEPARRLRGHARDRHRRLAAVAAGSRGRPAGRGVLRRRGGGLRRARARARQRVDRCGTRVSGRGHARTRRPRLPGGVPRGAGFLVLAEADGTVGEAALLRDELIDVLGEDALESSAPRARPSPSSGAGATASRSRSARLAAAK